MCYCLECVTIALYYGVGSIKKNVVFIEGMIKRRRCNGKEGTKGFIPLSIALHNGRIEKVSYTNSKITKPLFFIGAVLPDFKISWVILLGYVLKTTPIKKHYYKHLLLLQYEKIKTRMRGLIYGK